MRNATTDELGIQCNRAYIASGLSVTGFISLMEETNSDVFDVRETSFFRFTDDEIYNFYFASGAWYCKA